MHPKHVVGSNGTVWASEDRMSRYEKPHLFEVPDTTFSDQFKGACGCIKDKLINFKLSSMENDLIKVTNKQDCVFRKYETQKLNNVKFHMEKGITMLLKVTQENTEEEPISNFKQDLQDFIDMLNDAIMLLNSGTTFDVLDTFETLLSKAENILKVIQLFNLPDLKPRIFDQTDAGPGVGTSNKQVQYRAAERILIEGSDYYARIHRATGDCQNPVERTQAAVGKALGSGERIHWEYRKMFEGLDDDRKERMSLEEFSAYE